LVKKIFIPEKGDIVRLSFDPQAGHEQNGWRPGLVISNYTFNEATGFIVVCPITNTNRDYPFHIELPDNCKTSGVIMVDQAKSLDYIVRKAKLITKVSQSTLDTVMAIHQAIFQDDGK
jgi:mRNA interferase MazF